MLTNKDIRVENGNLVLNGDKYPLDGQSPAAIMQIVKDNSDSIPTENSDAPITSGGVYTALAGKQDNIVVASGALAASTGTATIQYPTGVNKTNYCIIGWNITSGNNKYSGYSMGKSGSQLSISMSDSNISVYNNDSTFYDAQIDIILAKI